MPVNSIAEVKRLVPPWSTNTRYGMALAQQTGGIP